MFRDLGRVHIVSFAVGIVGLVIGITGIVLAIVFGTTQPTCATPAPPTPCPQQTDLPTCKTNLFAIKSTINEIPWDDAYNDTSSPKYNEAVTNITNLLTTSLNSGLNSQTSSRFLRILAASGPTANNVNVQITQLLQATNGLVIAIGNGAIASAVADSSTMPNATTVQTVIDDQSSTYSDATTAQQACNTTVICPLPTTEAPVTCSTLPVVQTTNTPLPTNPPTSSVAPVTTTTQSTTTVTKSLNTTVQLTTTTPKGTSGTVTNTSPQVTTQTSPGSPTVVTTMTTPGAQSTVTVPINTSTQTVTVTTAQGTKSTSTPVTSTLSTAPPLTSTSTILVTSTQTVSSSSPSSTTGPTTTPRTSSSQTPYKSTSLPPVTSTSISVTSTIPITSTPGVQSSSQKVPTTTQSLPTSGSGSTTSTSTEGATTSNSQTTPSTTHSVPTSQGSSSTISVTTTQNSVPSSSTSVPSGPPTSSIPMTPSIAPGTSTAKPTIGPNQCYYQSNIAVAFELTDPNAAIDNKIQDFIVNSLLFYPGNPYQLGDAQSSRTKLALVPYPTTTKENGLMDYGAATSQSGISTALYVLGLTATKDAQINQSLDFISNLTYTGSPGFVIIIGNNGTSITGSIASSQLLQQKGFSIITVGYNSSSDFTPLASNQGFSFNIAKDSDELTVSQQIGSILNTTFCLSTTASPTTPITTASAITTTTMGVQSTSSATSAPTPTVTSTVTTVQTSTSVPITSRNPPSPSTTVMSSTTPLTSTVITSTTILSSTSVPAQSTSTPQVTSTSSPGTSTALPTLSPGQCYYQSNVAVAFELTNATSDIDIEIQNFISNDLFFYGGAPYQLGGQKDGKTQLSIVPYPNPDILTDVMAYGFAKSSSDIVTVIGIFDETAAEPARISDAFTIIPNNSRVGSPGFVILVANDATSVQASVDSANKLKALGFEIITVAFKSAGRFDTLSSDRSYNFQIHQDVDKNSVAMSIGNILNSTFCMPSGSTTPGVQTSTVTVPQGSSSSFGSTVTITSTAPQSSSPALTSTVTMPTTPPASSSSMPQSSSTASYTSTTGPASTSVTSQQSTSSAPQQSSTQGGSSSTIQQTTTVISSSSSPSQQTSTPGASSSSPSQKSTSPGRSTSTSTPQSMISSSYATATTECICSSEAPQSTTPYFSSSSTVTVPSTLPTSSGTPAPTTSQICPNQQTVFNGQVGVIYEMLPASDQQNTINDFVENILLNSNFYGLDVDNLTNENRTLVTAIPYPSTSQYGVQGYGSARSVSAFKNQVIAFNSVIKPVTSSSDISDALLYVTTNLPAGAARSSLIIVGNSAAMIDQTASIVAGDLQETFDIYTVSVGSNGVDLSSLSSGAGYSFTGNTQAIADQIGLKMTTSNPAIYCPPPVPSTSAPSTSTVVFSSTVPVTTTMAPTTTVTTVRPTVGPCQCTGRWVYNGDIVVAFEYIKNSEGSTNVTNFVRNTLLSNSDSYGLSNDVNGNQPSQLTLVPYPDSTDYPIYPYGSIHSPADIGNFIDAFSGIQTENKDPSIETALDYINTNLKNTSNTRVVLLVGSDGSDVNAATKTANEMKNAGYTVITVAQTAAATVFQPLSSGSQFAFHIGYGNENDVAIKIASLLLDISFTCFDDGSSTPSPTTRCPGTQGTTQPGVTGTSTSAAPVPSTSTASVSSSSAANTASSTVQTTQGSSTIAPSGSSSTIGSTSSTMPQGSSTTVAGFTSTVINTQSTVSNSGSSTVAPGSSSTMGSTVSVLSSSTVANTASSSVGPTASPGSSTLGSSTVANTASSTVSSGSSTVVNTGSSTSGSTVDQGSSTPNAGPTSTQPSVSSSSIPAESTTVVSTVTTPQGTSSSQKSTAANTGSSTIGSTLTQGSSTVANTGSTSVPVSSSSVGSTVGSTQSIISSTSEVPLCANPYNGNITTLLELNPSQPEIEKVVNFVSNNLYNSANYDFASVTKAINIPYGNTDNQDVIDILNYGDAKSLTDLQSNIAKLKEECNILTTNPTVNDGLQWLIESRSLDGTNKVIIVVGYHDDDNYGLTVQTLSTLRQQGFKVITVSLGTNNVYLTQIADNPDWALQVNDSNGQSIANQISSILCNL